MIIDIPPPPTWFKARPLSEKPSRLSRNADPSIPGPPHWFNFNPAPSEPPRTTALDSAIDAALQFGVAVDDVLQLMPEAYALLVADRDMIEPARRRACQLTGLNARRCNQWEDSYRDWTTYPRFDTSARTVAIEHPELGWNPNDIDTPAACWELIKAGALPPLAKNGREVADMAAELVARGRNRCDIEFAEWSFAPSSFDDSPAGEMGPLAGEPVTGETYVDHSADCLLVQTSGIVSNEWDES